MWLENIMEESVHMYYMAEYFPDKLRLCSNGQVWQG